MEIVFNIDLVSVGIAVAGSALLGFIIFFQNQKSYTNFFFLFFTITNAGWAIFNYLNYQIGNHDVALWVIRFVLFFAVLQSFSFYSLMLAFPAEKFEVRKRTYILLTIMAGIASLLTLTPFVFSDIIQKPGSVATPVTAPGIVFFGVTAISLVIGGITTLVNKIRKAKEVEEKKSFEFLLFGVVIMFSFIILFNFLFPTVFKSSRFIPLSAVFTLPFVMFTAYSIFKHHLLSVKVISTEVLTFALALGSLLDVILAKSLTELVFRSSIFLLVLGVGVLLIRSVLREVKQREELQVLTKQLEEANEQLKQLDKARAEFISIASHQLRTPPATIKWYLGAILTGDFGKLSDELKAAIERTNVTNNAQIHTIDDLLNASRIERGKLEFFFEKGKLEPIVSSLVEQLRPLAEMKKLKLEYTPPSQVMPEILLDQEKVRQVINNMIDNAIKYSKQGTIIVNLKQDQDSLVVSVTDNGKGIAPDELTTLFQKYSRGKDSVTHATGLGLGMYVAKVVVEQHHGKIWAESPGVGKGSTFLFSLPIHSDLKPTVVDLVAAQKSA